MLNITSQWQLLEISIFRSNGILQKNDRMLKPLVHKFSPDLSVRLRDIAEKQVHVKLKPK